MINLPNEFEEKMKALLGDEFEDYIKCYDEPRYYGLRVNTEKISVEDFVKICPFEITPIPWIDNGFYYDGEKISPAKHPYYFAGLYYLQGAECDDTGEPSSGRTGGPGTGCLCRTWGKGNRAWGEASERRCFW